MTDARDAARLSAALDGTTVHGVPGDVADADHRAALVEVVTDLGGLDLLVLNASTLGPLPMRPLSQYDPARVRRGVPHQRRRAGRADDRPDPSICSARDGVVVGISSDAAVQHYETWGGYGASKAALDHLVLTFGAETGLTTYAVDPGDMRTPMQQAAFPDEDISDRPLPERSCPGSWRSSTGDRRPAATSPPRSRSWRWRAHDDADRALGSPVPRHRRVDRCCSARGARHRARRRTPARRAARRPVAPPLRRPGRRARAGRPGRGEQLRHRQRRDRRPSQEPSRSCCTPPPGSTTAPGSSSCAPRPTRLARSWTGSPARPSAWASCR